MMANKAYHDHAPASVAPIALPIALYVVATPLGHLRDISLRALDVLAGVDAVAAEDTRTSGPFLTSYGIKAAMFSAHDHNENAAAARIVEMLAAGKRVALISDAGTPAVSDPGARIVRAVLAAGHTVTPIPGPSAVTGALSVAGCEGPFRFAGFLPTKSAARRKTMRELRAETATLVLYEAPHRIVDFARDLATEFEAARRVVVARELTKKFETVQVLEVSTLTGWLEEDTNRQRGEFVIVLDGAPSVSHEHAHTDRVLGILLAELPLKTAVKLASAITGASKNTLYERALEMQSDAGSADPT